MWASGCAVGAFAWSVFVCLSDLRVYTLANGAVRCSGALESSLAT